jgi:iron complex outermembrane receptor protein
LTHHFDQTLHFDFRRVMVFMRQGSAAFLKGVTVKRDMLKFGASRRVLVLVTAITAVSGVGSFAVAAAADEPTALEEVVVHATKRDESILTVPVSITAVTADQIERMGAKDLEDLAHSVPGLVVEQSSEQSDKIYVIRGIASGAQSATMSIYLDDTPITFGAYSPDLKLFDVSQVEVLRGPQGTLFGSSSMGGAIRYTSQQPGFGGVSGSLKAEVGAVQDGSLSYEVQGAVGGPIVEDRAAFRLSAFGRHDGGYIDQRDEDTGRVVDEDVNTVDSAGARAALALRLTDQVDLLVSAIYQQQNGDSSSIFFSARGVDISTPLPPMSRVDRANVYHNDKIFLPSLTLNADLGFAKLTSTSSYVDRQLDAAIDFSYFIQGAIGVSDSSVPDLQAQALQSSHFKAFIQEVRLTSQGDGPLQWIVGAYYQKTDEPGSLNIPTNLGAVDPFFIPLLLEGGSVFSRKNAIEREHRALFGEVSYTFAEKLKLTAGLRLSDLELSVGRKSDGLFNGGPSQIQLKSGEKPVTPKFSAQYFISPDAMIYATAAKGFREGGPNSPVPSGLPACAAALLEIGRTDAPDSFETDSVWSYEIGGKLQTSDRRLRVAASAYVIDWEGIQQEINLGGGCGFSYTDNVGKARSQGFEAEATWRPTDALRFDVGLGYTDASLSEDLITGTDSNGPVVAAKSGTQLPSTPDWTLSVAAQYDFQPIGEWDAYLRGEFQYIGEATRHLGTPSDDPRNLVRDSYELVNLRLGVRRDAYEFNLFVNNLFDDDTVLYQSFGSFSPAGSYEGIRVRPRVIGASLKRSF